MSKASIGIFDSGVGGLSVWKEVIKILPNESTIYYADSNNCPYGNKSQEEIIALSERIVKFFIEQDVKLIVVACNTATAAAIDYLRDNYNLPFVGMEPAVKPAALRTETGIVGVLATEGTFDGRLFNETSEKWASNIEVEVQVGKGFVELVEDGNIDTDIAQRTVEKVVLPLIDKGIDQLVLACTHYPFLMNHILKTINGKPINVINPAHAVAMQAINLLDKFNLRRAESKEPYYKFYTSGEPHILKQLVTKILPKYPIEIIKKVL